MSERLHKIFAAGAELIKQGQAPLIATDCVGTLTAWQKNAVNITLMRFWDLKAKEGYNAIVFSDDPYPGTEKLLTMRAQRDIGEPNLYMKKPGLDAFHIHHKEEYDGVEAFLVMDNNHESHKVNAEHKLDPNDPEVIAYMEAYVAAHSAAEPAHP